MGKRLKIMGRGSETNRNHRGDFETCFGCGYRMAHDRWLVAAHTINLRPDLFQSKGNVILYSRCPKCSESSWIHIDFGSIRDNSDFPKAWLEGAKQEAAAQQLAGLREWGAALCWKCDLLESGEVKFGTFRTCEIGMGPAQTSCEQFRRRG